MLGRVEESCYSKIFEGKASPNSPQWRKGRFLKFLKLPEGSWTLKRQILKFLIFLKILNFIKCWILKNLENLEESWNSWFLTFRNDSGRFQKVPEPPSIIHLMRHLNLGRTHPWSPIHYFGQPSPQGAAHTPLGSLGRRRIRICACFLILLQVCYKLVRLLQVCYN